MNAPPPRDPPSEADFLRAVEERFRALRGRPLLLSPSDTRQAIAWHTDGVPLDVALGTIDELFARAAEAGRRGPRSLRYCDDAVRDAAARAADLRAGGERHASGARSADPAARARAFERAAKEIRESGAPASAREEAACGVERLAGGTAAGESDPLLEIETALVDACLASLDGETLARLEEAARASIAPWSGRMSAEVRARAESRALTRAIRERFGVPDLSRLPLPAPGDD